MERRCEALTSKGHQCRKKAEQYRRYDDGREYLSCKQHVLYFRPHPGVVREKEAVADGGE